MRVIPGQRSVTNINMRPFYAHTHLKMLFTHNARQGTWGHQQGTMQSLSINYTGDPTVNYNLLYIQAKQLITQILRFSVLKNIACDSINFCLILAKWH
jgi:hypothetical protein